MTRSVSFSDDLTIIPDDILSPYNNVFTSIEDDEFCQSLKRPSDTLEQSARVLQRFVRANTIHWRYFNHEKCRILEAMDDVMVMKRGELERVSDCVEEMKREAEMEIAMEFGGDEIKDDQELKAQVEHQKHKVKELEAENARLKTESEEIKSKNKKIAMDTFSMYESFTKAIFDVKELQSEQNRLQQIRDKFAQCVKSLKAMMKTVTEDIARARYERQQLDECMNQVIEILEERCSTRKLIARLYKIKLEVSNQIGSGLLSY